MNDSADKTKRKRRRSEDYSSSDDSPSRSKSRSRDDRKRSKKSKKKHSKSSTKKSKRKRSKSTKKDSKKDNKKKDRRRSKTRSPSSASESNHKHPTINKMMDPMMSSNYMYFPHMMQPMDPRLIRPSIYYPPMKGSTLPGGLGDRMPMASNSIPMKTEIGLPDQPTDKIVKDQNFLNSDEKLFESIVNNEIGLRNIFEDTQISEHYAGSTLYKTVKKFVHDPNTLIFESAEKTKDDNVAPKPNEIIKNAMASFIYENSYNKISLNISDMQNITEQLYNYRNRHKTEELNHI